MRRVMLLVMLAAGPAAADPRATAGDPQPLTRAPSVQPFLVFDPPPAPVKSLRLEALRIAGERSDSDWRYPDPGPVLGYQDGTWFMGYGHYRPRTARSAALHGGSMAATLLGEILIGTGSPLAGVGALVTGATLDAAAADVDRDAEAKRPRQ
jgi:hypothetical protein